MKMMTFHMCMEPLVSATHVLIFFTTFHRLLKLIWPRSLFKIYIFETLRQKILFVDSVIPPLLYIYIYIYIYTLICLHWTWDFSCGYDWGFICNISTRAISFSIPWWSDCGGFRCELLQCT